MYTFPQSVGIAGRHSSSSNYFVGSQADNLFYLGPHHTCATVPLRPPTQMQTMERIVSVESRLGHPCLRGDQYNFHLPAIIVSQRHPHPAAQAHLRSHTRPPRHHPYQNNCPRTALHPDVHTCVGTWLAQMAVVGDWGLVLSGEAGGRPGLDATQVHYVTSHTLECAAVHQLAETVLDTTWLV